MAYLYQSHRRQLETIEANDNSGFWFWFGIVFTWLISIYLFFKTFSANGAGTRGTAHRIYPISAVYLGYILGPLAGGCLALGLFGWQIIICIVGIIIGLFSTFVLVLFNSAAPENQGTL
jgi:MFS family permease